MLKLPKWLPIQESKIIFDALKIHGFECRFVGGCVRDILFNRKSTDVDIATTATPIEVTENLKSKNIKVIPTGLKYGTVTAIINGHNFEITTLRNDIKSDGRHAEISFTKSWEEDALRRDFTINAMSMTLGCEIHDYFNGLEDIKSKLIKFVGDPDQRIIEDHLRILRYFRFISYFGKEKIDNKSLKACEKNSHLLQKISGERIHNEMFKILTSPHILDSLILMHKTGTLKFIGINSLPKNIDKYKFSDSALINLAAILRSSDHKRADTLKLATKWRLSNNEKFSLVQMVEFDYDLWKMPKNAIRKLIYKFGKLAFMNFIELLQIEIPNDNYLTLKEYATSWKLPIFKIKGENIAKLGYNGRDIGKILQKLHNLWIDSDFEMNEELLISRAKDGI